MKQRRGVSILMSTKRWSSKLLSGFLSFVLFLSTFAASLLGPVGVASAAVSKSGNSAVSADATKGVIQGRITDEDGKPLPVGTMVGALVCEASSGLYFPVRPPVEAQPDGSYSVTVEPGEYVVEFHAEGNYVDEYYSGTTTAKLATRVTVESGSITSGIDGKLKKGGRIIGKVTNADGSPLAGVSVHAAGDNAESGFDFFEFDPFGFDPFGLGYTADTGPDGMFTLEGLPTDNYRLKIDPQGANEADDTDYVGEWYNDKSSYGASTPISVTQGSDTTVLPSALEVGGRITGNVTDEKGRPVGYNAVYAYDASTSKPEETLGTAYTDEDGSYTMRGIPANKPFKVQFESPWDSIHVGEWYDNAPSYQGAKTLEVGVGESKTDVDAVLDKGGRILGKVTDPQGKPVEGVDVYASETGDGEGYGYAITDEKGNYAVEGLQTGNYAVDFDPQAANDNSNTDFLEEWYNDKTSYETASPVAVAKSKDKGGVNVALAVGGRITGSVTDEQSKKALKNAVVSVYDASAAEPVDVLGTAYTKKDGSYTMRGLATDKQYKVKFNGQMVDSTSTTSYIDEWFNNASNFAGAKPIKLASGKTQSGISAELGTGAGSISGTVTDDLGNPFYAMPVVYDDQGRPVTTGEVYGGMYFIGGLKPGSYKLRFDTSFFNEWTDRPQCSEWYHDASSFDTASLIEVKADTDTAGINEQLSNAADETEPPTVPANLSVARSGDALKLKWTASTDNVLVTEYKIERTTNETDTVWPEIATSPTNSFTDTTASPNVRYYYRVRAVDMEENVSDCSNVASGIVDKQAPNAPAGLKIARVGGSFCLTWKESADNVGVKSYKLERSAKDQSHWQAVAATVEETRTDGALAPETLYYYRVRAMDAAGNTSGASNVVSATSPKQSSISKEETAPYLSWTGSWTSMKNASYSGGASKRASAAETTLVVPFRGTSVSWIGTKASKFGKSEVYLDDKLVATCDQYASTTAFKQTIFSKGGLADTAHTLKIKVLGAKQASSTGTNVDVDGIKVGGYCPGFNVEQTSVTATGTWTTASNALHSGGSTATSMSTNSVIELKFTGTSISWIGAVGTNRGIAKVYVDQLPAVTVDQYAKGTAFQQAVYSKSGLSNGKHTIKIVVTGSKRAAATDKVVDVDSFVVK